MKLASGLCRGKVGEDDCGFNLQKQALNRPKSGFLRTHIRMILGFLSRTK